MTTYGRRIRSESRQFKRNIFYLRYVGRWNYQSQTVNMQRSWYIVKKYRFGIISGFSRRKNSSRVVYEVSHE